MVDWLGFSLFVKKINDENDEVQHAHGIITKKDDDDDTGADANVPAMSFHPSVLGELFFSFIFEVFTTVNC